MAKLHYETCQYDGGFKAMKASRSVTLDFSATQFSVRRSVLFARSARRLWAKWTAVTDLTVTDDRAGARLALTTKAQGTGTIVIPGETAGDIWEVLDQLADLKERFHSPAASPGQEAGADEGGGGDPDDEAGADEGGGSDAGADEAGGV